MCDAAGAVRYLTLPISGELAGSEVNTLLRRHLGLSGTVLRRVKWLSDGITVDGARVNVRFRVAAGQVLSVRLSDPDSASQPLPRPGPLDLVYEDEDLVVVNKAPGVLVHPSHGHFDDTVGNFLMARYRENREGAGFHPVHRLDKGTSGLLVVAKHPYGQEKLKSQLHTGAFRRIYLAVCDGTPYPAQGVIDAPIGRAPGSLLARRVDPELDTGRTHQIRVHMAHMGCPLTGDFLYGREAPALITRPALHSARLELTHPITRARLEFTAPLPEDMKVLL